jgi:carbon-monoxide dehydrogenase iron sulfur subunit
MTACATAHSKTKTLFSAVGETPRPKPRIHLGTGLYREGFPNRCRHCNPAPCLTACLPGAIFREPETGTVLIDPDRCINCASCAMACPFGVIRYHADAAAPPGKVVAVKCDNCLARQEAGMIPACVEMCVTGALTFEDPAKALKKKTDRVAETVSAEAAKLAGSPGFTLLNAVKQAQVEIGAG